MVLLDPKAKTPRLNSLLKQAGVIPLDNRVLRTVRLPFATGILREVTAEFLPKNAITKRMVGINILLPGATQSLTFDAAQSQAAGVQIWPLIQAGEEFWGETDYVTDEKKGVRYDEGKDAGQPRLCGHRRGSRRCQRRAGRSRIGKTRSRWATASLRSMLLSISKGSIFFSAR